MNAPRRKPENNETNAARQARLRERRKAQGFRRVSVWLSPDQVDRMERQGGEPWRGIAKQWNEQGRRTATGAVFRGMNLARDYRKWKGGEV